jgi:hypothetical protein
MISLIIGIVIGAVFSPILIKLAKIGYNYINTKVNKLGK